MSEYWIGFQTGVCAGFLIVMLALIFGMKVGFKPYRSKRNRTSTTGVAK